MREALNDQEYIAATRSIETARGLPGRAYTSPEWAQTERDELLGQTWTCLAFVDELPMTRYALPLEFMGLPLVMVRGKDDVVRVFHNVCRHRGHILVKEPGEIKAGFVCPYHFWNYRLDGSLRATPHIGGTRVHEDARFDKSKHGLNEVRSAVWQGMTFINLSGEAEPFDDFIRPLVMRWEALTGAGELQRLVMAPAEGNTVLELKANWKLAVENYLESYHLPFVHPGLNSYSKIEDHYNIMAGDWGGGQGSKAFNYAERTGVNFPKFPNWAPGKETQAEYIALYPNVMLGLQIDHFFAMIIRPVDQTHAHESVRLFYTDEAALKDELITERGTMLNDWMSVFMEDIDVVEGMQLGRQSLGFDGGAFSPFHDEATHHFHGWVARRMARVKAGEPAD